jgi:hypothetical protein
MTSETGVQPKHGTQSVHVIPTAAPQKGGKSQFANGSTVPIVAMAGLGIAVVAAIGYALGRKK